ncbi:hypothetical protein ABC426_00630 [Lactiplantibacillus plantarum]|uniref:hypothetical protein n=1 Tax=Lactiplantibacillus plantarum TaxID=1590 RepID=UPI001BAB7F3E|nr:hypothetical protein [Lactiplantibacillus plantarum]MBS0953594.1 hypothetical protein [Lactiplantibacillus plantarum]
MSNTIINTQETLSALGLAVLKLDRDLETLDKLTLSNIQEHNKVQSRAREDLKQIMTAARKYENAENTDITAAMIDYQEMYDAYGYV